MLKNELTKYYVELKFSKTIIGSTYILSKVINQGEVWGSNPLRNNFNLLLCLKSYE